MKVGVTGSRTQRPIATTQRLREVLIEWRATELHHGDCVGWDEQAHHIAKSLGIKTVAHPPTVERYRAFTKSDVILPAKPYLDRNKDIVNAVDFIIAAPDGPEKQRSGTWSTVRYARKVGVNGVVWL